MDLAGVDAVTRQRGPKVDVISVQRSASRTDVGSPEIGYIARSLRILQVRGRAGELAHSEVAMGESVSREKVRFVSGERSGTALHRGARA